MDERNKKESTLPSMQEEDSSMAFLGRAAEQDFYAERLADIVERQGLMTAPINLKTSIMERSRQLDVQVIAKTNLASKKLELFYYGLKLGTAVAVSVCFIMIAPVLAERQYGGPKENISSYSQDYGQPGAEHIPIHERFSSRLKNISGMAQEIFNESLNMEVFSHDK